MGQTWAKPLYYPTTANATMKSIHFFNAHNIVALGSGLIWRYGPE